MEATLGFNPINPPVQREEVVDPLSFRAVDYHTADYDAINEQLSEADWEQMHHLCENEEDFLELIRLTVLQAVLQHSPYKLPPGNRSKPKNNKSLRERNILKRRKRKLRVRINALKTVDPGSPTISALEKKVHLLSYEIQQSIVSHLNATEDKVVSVIKSNPKYFVSFAKR